MAETHIFVKPSGAGDNSHYQQNPFTLSHCVHVVKITYSALIKKKKYIYIDYSCSNASEVTSTVTLTVTLLSLLWTIVIAALMCKQHFNSVAYVGLNLISYG